MNLERRSLIVALSFLAAAGAMAQDLGTQRVSVVFSGGHETEAVDRGRPVTLIAAALGVTDEVFREAFSRVRPAPAGQEPDPRRVRSNKDVLMAALGPHGVENDRLDEVSNHYRYDRRRGELWPIRAAVAWALVEGGRIVGFEVEDGGSGYSSPPSVFVDGFGPVATRVDLAFGPDLETIGSVRAIALDPE